MGNDLSIATAWLSVKESFETRLSEIEIGSKSTFEFCSAAARLAITSLAEVDKIRTSLPSPDDPDAEKVVYFKVVKPFFLSQNIYYSKRCLIEELMPADPESRNHFISSQIEDARRAYEHHRFIRTYLNGNLSFLDDRLFFDASAQGAVAMFGSEPLPDGYNVCYDRAVAEIRAADLLIAWLIRIREKMTDVGHKKLKLRFTKPKVKAVELAYAFYAAGVFNDGKASLQDIVDFMETHWDLNMGYVPRSFQEIQYRKKGYVVFLNELIIDFRRYIENLSDRNTG